MEKLGIEPSLLFAQVVNFAIIVVVLTKLLYQPVLSMLEKRRKEIAEGLALTERLRIQEEKMATRSEKLIAQARTQARALLEEGKKAGEEAKREIIAGAHREATEIVDRAKREAAATHEALEGSIRREAVELAVTIAKRLTARVLSPAHQHALIAKHLREIEKTL